MRINKILIQICTYEFDIKFAIKTELIVKI